MIDLIFFSMSFLLLSNIIINEFISRERSYILSYISLNLIILYVISPVVVIYLGVGFSSNFESFNLYTYKDYIAGIVLLFSICFYIGTVIKVSNPVLFYFYPQKNYRKLIVFIFFISICSFCSFVYIYGGIEYVLSNISRIRSGVDDNKSYIGAFLKMFSYYIELVLFYFFSLFLLNTNNKTRNFKLLFIFIFVLAFALLKSFIDGGRGGFINIFVGLIITYFFVRKVFPKFFLLLSLPIILSVGLFGKMIAASFKSDAKVDYFSNFNSIIDAVITEYSHQVLSVGVGIETDSFGERYFFDFIAPLLKPLKLIGIDDLDSVSYYNTFIIKGEWDSEVPPGIIQFLLLQTELYFFPFLVLLLGFFIKYIDRSIFRTLSNSNECAQTKAFSIASCSIFFIYFPFIILNSDLALFVQWCFVYLLLFFTLYALNYFKLVRKLN